MPLSQFQRLLVFMVESTAVVAAAAWQLCLHDVIAGLHKHIADSLSDLEVFDEVLEK